PKRSPRQRADRNARRLGPLHRRAGGDARRRGRERAARQLATAVATATLGRARRDATPVRRADAGLAGRDGRLRALAAACGRTAIVTDDITDDVARPSSLAGVRYGFIQRHGDSRGSFRELWRASAFPGRAFVQANLSTSAQGVLRGLHLHRRQDDVWVVGA